MRPTDYDTDLTKIEDKTLIKRVFGCQYSHNESRLIKYTGYLGNREEVTINSATKIICDNCFAGDSTITEICIPEGVTHLGSFAFARCSSLTKITLPDSLESIGRSAFVGCKSLEEIIIGRNLRAIGANAFAHCSSLNKLISNSLHYKYENKCLIDTDIKTLLFHNGNNNVVLSSEIVAFDRCVFMNSDITSIILPNSIIDIPEGAFKNCKHLKEIIIPTSVKTIGTNAFTGCTNLTCKNVRIESANYTIKDGILYDTEYTNLISAFDVPHKIVLPPDIKIIPHNFFANKNISEIILPEGLLIIESSAFEGCSLLEKICIPKSVITIGHHTFSKCISLSEITFNGSFEIMAEHLFSECYSLASINIPEGVKTIESDAFNNCQSLCYCHIPSTLENIAVHTFMACISLKRIDFDERIRKFNCLKEIDPRFNIFRFQYSKPTPPFRGVPITHYGNYQFPDYVYENMQHNNS